MGKTLFEKIWEKHIVNTIDGGPAVLYIDKHFIHEVTSPQAFNGLNKRGIKVFRPAQTVATADHNVPTLNQHLPIKEELSRLQVEALKKNCGEHHVELYGLGHPFQGIVHVIGPELGITIPQLRAKLTARYEWEIVSRSRLDGEVLTLSLSFLGWRPQNGE